MFCPRFAVHESDRVPNDEIEIAEIHFFAGFVETERKADRYTRPISFVSLVVAQYVLEVMRNNIDQMELLIFLRPKLAVMTGLLTVLLGKTIDRMVDRYAREEGEARRASVGMEIIPRRIDDHFQVSLQSIHSLNPFGV